jgi:hypothetical protein
MVIGALARSALRIFCFAVVAGNLMTRALATTVTLTPVADSEIRQFSPDNNYGGLTSMVSGAVGNNPGANHEKRRGVLRFDLSQVPAGAVVNSASLKVTVVRVPLTPVNSNFDLRRLLQPWNEGEVTWNSHLAGAPWQTPGATGAADSVGTPSSVVFVTGLGGYTFASSGGLVGDVQAWVNDPTSNNGWLLISEDEISLRTARHFGTREDPANAPVLTVDFTVSAALTITTQPSSQAVVAGTNAVFSVVANGRAPLSYQWFFNTTTPIPGATASTLLLQNVQQTNAGVYTVTVSNQDGTVTSQPATLTVLPVTSGPFVTIISPTNGAVLPGHTNVTVVATAGEAGGTITQVEFFLGSNPAGISTNTPYQTVLTNLADGPYVLSAIATDARGLTATSAPVSITILSPKPGLPTVSIVSPTNSAVLPGHTNIFVLATASETNGSIKQVEFFLGATPVGVSTNAPYRTVLTNLVDGRYVLGAIATDARGLTATSAPVSITLDSIKPTITLEVSPPNFSRQTNNSVSLAGVASDNIGVARIQYQVNSGPPTNATGTTTWAAQVQLAPGNNTVQLRSIDLAGNSSPTVTRYFTYVVTGRLLVQALPFGTGTVTPDLNGKDLLLGNIYTLTAKPEAGQIFSNWTVVGITNLANFSSTNSAALNFEMQSNLTQLAANFVPNPFLLVAGTYTGLFTNQAGLTALNGISDTNQVALESSGFVRLQLGTAGSFSGRLTMASGTFPFQGQFNLSGTSSVPVLRPARIPVVLNLSVPLTGGTNLLSGTAVTAIGTNVLTSALVAQRNGFSSTNTPSFAGPHKFAMNFLSGEQAGAGTAMINRNGSVSIIVGLQGQSLTGVGTVVSLEGDVPFCVVFGGGKEEVLGWMAFQAGPPDVVGSLLWIKAQDPHFPAELQVIPRAP